MRQSCICVINAKRNRSPPKNSGFRNYQRFVETLKVTAWQCGTGNNCSAVTRPTHNPPIGHSRYLAVISSACSANASILFYFVNPLGAMLTLETISLDSISEKQGWYIRWVSLTRPRHEMLLVRGMEPHGYLLEKSVPSHVCLHYKLK